MKYNRKTKNQTEFLNVLKEKPLVIFYSNSFLKQNTKKRFKNINIYNNSVFNLLKSTPLISFKNFFLSCLVIVPSLEKVLIKQDMIGLLFNKKYYTKTQLLKLKTINFKENLTIFNNSLKKVVTFFYFKVSK